LLGATFATVAPLRIDEQVGRVLEGRYRLTSLLGTGTSAHVYVADDVRLRRRVAVKVLHPGLAGDDAFLRRFRAEAQVVAALRHPNIGRVYDWGQDDGAPFLVMELLEGGSLRSLLDTGYLLSPGQVLRLGIEAGGALDHAHRRGLVHRDIKPANLIFDDEGHVSVADFGLARALAESTWTEPVGAVVGTARYAAPEQVRGHALDARADIYALALVLVEAATGRVPFAIDTTLGTLMARVEQPLDVGADLGPLNAILEAAGTVDPADRLDSAALVRALKVLADRVPPPQALPRAGPLSTGVSERDDSPTEIPGTRPTPFDIDDVSTPDPTPNPTPEPVLEPVPPSPPPSTAVPERRRGRRLLAVVAAAAVVAAGAGVAVVAWPVPTHPVPGLRGDSEGQARGALGPFHLKLAVGARAYDPIAPAGTITEQRPPTGRLAEGRAVTVTVSRGPRPLPIPSLVNQTREEAAAAVAAAGLTVGAVTTATSLTVAAGRVIDTRPDNGTLLPSQAVDLIVSTGKPTVAVPTLSGPSAASYSGAEAALSALGLVAAESQEFSDSVPSGTVVGSDPGPGFAAPLGSTVTVVVSKGPDLVTVPSVRGSVAAASAALSAQGFSVSGVTGNPTAAVTSTTPAAGTRAHRGSAVQLVTG